MSLAPWTRIAFRTGVTSVFITATFPVLTEEHAIEWASSKCLLYVTLCKWWIIVEQAFSLGLQAVDTCVPCAQRYATCGRRIVGLQMT